MTARVQSRAAKVGTALALAACALAGTAQAQSPDQSSASPPPVAAYGELPGIEDVAISPGSESLAIAARVKGQRTLQVLGTDGKLHLNAPLGDAKLRYIRWAGDEQVIVVASKTEGLGYGFTTSKVELSAALLVSPRTQKIDQVFANRAAMLSAVFSDYGSRRVNGRWQTYFGGVELRKDGMLTGYVFDHGRPALFAVDQDQNVPRRAAPAPSESYWREWLIDGDGVVAATFDINHVNGRWSIVNSQRKVLASGIDPTADVSLISFGKEGDSVVYSTEDPDGATVRWFEVPLAGGTPAEILAGVDIERLYVDSTNGRMLGYLEGGAAPKPTFFAPQHQTVTRKIFRAFPNRDLEITGWTPSFSHVVVHTSGNGDSGTWYRVDMARLRAEEIGTDYPLIPATAVGPISSVSYTAGDGLALDGVLTLPPGKPAKNLPAIMLPHGGPHTHDRVRFDWWAQALASRGYAVFQPNFRGSTNRDNAFRRAGYGQWGRAMQTDISDGLAELARQGIVDPRRVCIVGASYGGYAALAGVTLQQGLYRCAVAVAPVSDLGDMYRTENRESGDNRAIARSMRESLGSPAGFAAVSPRRSAAKADAPILLIHGRDDTVVPYSQSSAMASALRSAGKPHELVELREEDHWLSRSATRLQMLEATLGFVSRHNPAN